MDSPIELKPIIKQVVRLFRKHHLDYNQTSYIIKEARKELKLTAPKKTSGTVTRLSITELESFICSAFKQSPLVGLMMTTLYETGVRVDEFVHLMPSDLYPEENKIIVQHGKGDKRREIPIEATLSQALQIHLAKRTQGYIFESNRNKKFTVRRIQQIVKEVTESTSIQTNVTPHVLRHTRATLLAEGGMSTDLLQQFLGHEKPETTQIYTKTAGRNMRAGFEEATDNLRA